VGAHLVFEGVGESVLKGIGNIMFAPEVSGIVGLR
jgi:hypothetical protein